MTINFKHKSNFVSDEKVFMVRCEKCDLENWAPAVASGHCAWCGYDGNELLRAPA